MLYARAADYVIDQSFLNYRSKACSGFTSFSTACTATGVPLSCCFGCVFGSCTLVDMSSLSKVIKRKQVSFFRKGHSSSYSTLYPVLPFHTRKFHRIGKNPALFSFEPDLRMQ